MPYQKRNYQPGDTFAAEDANYIQTQYDEAMADSGAALSAHAQKALGVAGSHPMPTPEQVGAIGLPPGPAKGDLLYYDGTSWTRLPIGLANQFLKVDEAGGDVEWKSESVPFKLVRTASSTHNRSSGTVTSTLVSDLPVGITRAVGYIRILSLALVVSLANESGSTDGMLSGFDARGNFHHSDFASLDSFWLHPATNNPIRLLDLYISGRSIVSRINTGNTDFAGTTIQYRFNLLCY